MTRGTDRGGEPFFFGVPLIARAQAPDWGRDGDLLELTLRSVLAQTDGDFTLLLAGHDVPECWGWLTRGDARFRFLHAEWGPQAATGASDNGGAKKWMTADVVRRAGGGLLMDLDADDLINRRTVGTARAMLDREHIAGVIDHGLMLDFPSLRAVSLPRCGVYDGPSSSFAGPARSPGSSPTAPTRSAATRTGPSAPSIRTMTFKIKAERNLRDACRCWNRLAGIGKGLQLRSVALPCNRNHAALGKAGLLAGSNLPFTEEAGAVRRSTTSGIRCGFNASAQSGGMRTWWTSPRGQPVTAPDPLQTSWKGRFVRAAVSNGRSCLADCP